MGPPALTETTIRYAAMADCLQTVADAYQPSLGD